MQTTPSIRRQSLRQQRQWITWYLAWSLMLLGFVGTIVTANGGWGQLLSGRFSWNMTILAFALQVILTYVQWAWYDIRPLAYFSRTIDALFTALGYGSVIYVYAIDYFNGYDLFFVSVIYWLITFVLSVFIAWYPEYRLVRD